MLMHLAEAFPDAVAKLTIQYRMNEAICHLPNMIGKQLCHRPYPSQRKCILTPFHAWHFLPPSPMYPCTPAYDGLLKCGNDAVRHQRLEIRPTRALDIFATNDRQWIDYAIDPERPVIFLDTDGKGMLESNGARSRAGGPTNDAEVNIVAKLAISLELSGVKNSDIGLITPFRSQVCTPRFCFISPKPNSFLHWHSALRCSAVS